MYVEQKLGECVEILAVGTDKLQQRLARAALPLLFVHEPAFPNDASLTARFQQLVARLHQGDRTVAQTTETFTDDEASKVAKEIWSLYQSAVTEQLADASRAK
jgi:hypothetical protein